MVHKLTALCILIFVKFSWKIFSHDFWIQNIKLRYDGENLYASRSCESQPKVNIMVA